MCKTESILYRHDKAQSQAIYHHSTFCNKPNPFYADMKHHIDGQGTYQHCTKPNPYRAYMTKHIVNTHSQGTIQHCVCSFLPYQWYKCENALKRNISG